MNREQLERELEWRRCEDSCRYFLENYWFIKVAGGATLFKLRPGQVQALEVWEARSNAISLKARQIGWTTLAAGYLFWLVFFGENRECVALSKTQSDAKRYISMARFGYKRLPDWLRERGPSPVKGQDNQLVLGFDNDSVILSLPSRDDPARGYTGYCIVVDEWASLNNPAEAWAAVEPAADAGGQIIGFSTAKGYGDWFHNFWTQAINGQNSFVPMFFAWDSVPDRDEEWYAQKIRDFEPWQIRQEYPASPDEAFVAAGDSVYDVDMLTERIEVLTPGWIGDLAFDERGEVRLISWDEGPLAVWELPQVGAQYVVGADVASGAPDGDNSAAHVLKVDTGRVVARFKGKITPEDFADFLDKLGLWYNRALMAPERNGPGLAVVHRLSDVLKYPNPHFHTRDNVNRSVTRNFGWVTSDQSKQFLVSELGAALRRGRIILHDEDTMGELKAFRRLGSSMKGERYGGAPHDDLVMSLGIAVCVMREVMVRDGQIDEQPKALPGTMAYWEKMLDQASAISNRSGTYTVGWTNRGKVLK